MKKWKRYLASFLALLLIIAVMPSPNVEAATVKLSKCTIKLSKTSYYYTGAACKPKVTVKYGKKVLKYKTDYTYSYSKNVTPGTAAVTVKGKGKYSGTVKKTFKIKNALSVTLSKTSYTYSGRMNKPSVVVKSGKTKLSGKYYSVTYKNYVNAGTASVTVKGKGKYRGKNAYVTYKIAPKSIGNMTIYLSETEYTYTGGACKPKVTVKNGTATLKNGTDYTVSYQNNVAVGSATVTVQGKGNYTGTVKRTFEIKDVPNQPGGDPSNDPNKITVVENKVSYKTAGQATGSFVSGALPNNILSGFDATDGRTGMNHPNGIATDGEHFVVCDTWNNRVLVYNCLPTGGELPDVVLGQPDFESFDAGKGECQMNWPVGATFAKGKLFITDTNNYRVLVYDGIPETNGAQPEAIINMISENLSTAWPWAVWSDGENLVLTCTLGGRVAIWNDAQTAVDGEYADIILSGMGTPRTIVSDGNYLLVGDHNVNGQPQSGCYVWKTFPTSNSSQYDFICDKQYGGTIIDGNLYLRENGAFHIFDGLIDSENEQPLKEFSPRDGCLGGDYNSIIYANGKTYIASYNSSYIAIYNGKITEEKMSKPDGLLGASEYMYSMSVERGIYQNPVMASDGTSLVISDDFNRMLAVYKTIPDDNNARADYEYMFASASEYPVDVDIDDEGRMYVLTPYSVLMWNRVPVNGEMYDVRYELGSEPGIGTLNAKLTVDGEHVYIASETDRKIYVFNRNAMSFRLSDAKKFVEYGPVRDIFSNGEYLVIANQNENKVDIYKTLDLTLYGTVKSESMGGEIRIANPASSIILPDGKLVVANTGNNVVYIYDSIDAAISNYKDYKVSLGNNDAYRVDNYNGGPVPVKEITGIATESTLFSPTTLSYKDGHLWVGEFKFSSRMFRYDLK